jgi:hypothetical protein
MSHEERRAQLQTMLERVVSALGDDLDNVVFVGGMAASFYVASVRVTDDVDCMVDMATPAYYQLGDRLRTRGFREDRASGVICRWRLGHEGGHVTLDVVPTRGEVLGFSTRWYPEAFVCAQSVALPSGRVVRLITPLYLVATKIEAFKDRGQGDFAASHDLEDLVAVLASDASLRARIRESQEPVCLSIRGDLRAMGDSLLDVLINHLSDEEQGEVLEQLFGWLRSL